MDFLAEFKNLLLAQPTYNLRSVNNENCPYVHMITFSRNSYMCFTGYRCEDCGYCYYPVELRDCWDTYFAVKCELCYECVSCSDCYNCDFCNECTNCRDSKFCYDCKGCNSCFGCVGLRQKEYYIFNEPYSKEAYFEKLKIFDIKNPQICKEIEAKVETLRSKHPHLTSIQLQTENCTGDHIFRSKNCAYAFATNDSEDCAYTFHVMDRMKDDYDTNLMANSELLYECIIGYELYNCNFMLECGSVRDSEFCVRCFNSHHVFGCASRNHASYEILNKPYEPAEWERKMKEIKQQLSREGNYRNFLPDVVPIEW